jgi:hypothetical protein
VGYNQVYNLLSGLYPAIEVYDGNGNRIVHNGITNIASHGIWLVTDGLTSGCSHNEIEGNAISGVSDYWVVITNSGSTGNVIESNTLLGAKSIDDHGTGTIVRNNIFGQQPKSMGIPGSNDYVAFPADPRPL